MSSANCETTAVASFVKESADAIFVVSVVTTFSIGSKSEDKDYAEGIATEEVIEMTDAEAPTATPDSL